MRYVLAALFLTCLAPASAATAADATLVMFESPGCGWCAAWERDVGRVYDKTDEGRALPLRRVELRRRLPDEYAGLAPIAYTPTFVAMRCGREIGRVTGYSGEADFYGLLNEIIRTLPREPAPC